MYQLDPDLSDKRVDGVPIIRAARPRDYEVPHRYRVGRGNRVILNAAYRHPRSTGFMIGRYLQAIAE